MSDSNAKAKMNEYAGKAREKVGDMTDNEEMQAKGKAQEMKGKAQGAANDAKESAKDVAESAKRK